MGSKAFSSRTVQLAFASAVLVLVGAISYRAMAVSTESERWGRHTHEMRETLQSFILATERVKSSYVGFALTGQGAHLESYRASRSSAEKELANLRALTADKPEQQRRIPELEQLAAQQIQLAETIISLRRPRSLEAAVAAIDSGQGKQITDGLQGVVRDLQDEEQQLRALRITNSTLSRRRTGKVLILGATLGLLITAAAAWSVHRDRGPAGALLRSSGISRDLGENTDSGAKYRGLLEAAPDAMVVVNQGGDIVLVNAQAETQFGYHRDELLGQPVTNLILDGFAARLIADDLRSAEEALAQQMGTGIELIGTRKNGSTFPIELMLSPLQSAEGILVTAAIRNITVRKTAQQSLAQMEGRYRGLLEAAPDAMVVVNQAGNIVLLNVQAEKQFGYHRDELLGQPVKSLVPDGFAEQIVADGLRSAEDALAQQIGTGIELIGRRKDGTEFPIELMLSPLESAEGILVTAAIRDIAPRKQAEAHLLQKMDELNRSNEELGQFAYIVSHELQEPLRMVARYTQLLSRRYKGKLDADADEFIAFAENGATRMQRLIRDLLAYSGIGTKGNGLLLASSEDALQQALLDLRGAIEESGAVVTHDPLPTLPADEVQLAQLFQNLIGNAIKYQKPGTPRIHVAATRSGGPTWTFSVQDNGLGIDPQYFEKIFGMFQRLHKREEFAGTGIGLAICKKIVERHGGSISVESQPGRGSTFSFALAANGFEPMNAPKERECA